MQYLIFNKCAAVKTVPPGTSLAELFDSSRVNYSRFVNFLPKISGKLISVLLFLCISHYNRTGSEP